MTHDQGERWDNRRKFVRLTDIEAKEWLRLTPCSALYPYWTGPTNPVEARIADDCMVALGTILAQRQFSNHYDTDSIYRAMRNVRKAQMGGRRSTIYCSFCGKSQHEVVKIIQGGGDTAICDECVYVCLEMIEGPPKMQPGDLGLPA